MCGSDRSDRIGSDRGPVRFVPVRLVPVRFGPVGFGPVRFVEREKNKESSRRYGRVGGGRGEYGRRQWRATGSMRGEGKG